MAAKKTKRKTNKGKKLKPHKRPNASKRSKALDDSLCEWLTTGQGLRPWCRANNVAVSTAYMWAASDPELADRIALARERGARALEEEVREIADTRNTDDPDDVQHRKLQIYARERLLAWTGIERYRPSNKIQPIAQIAAPELSDEERARRIQQLLAKAGGPPPAENMVQVQIHDESD